MAQLRKRRGRMRDRAVSVLDGGKICMALLRGAVLIALSVADGNVALSQTASGNVTRAPLFIAIDLTPEGSVTSKAFGAAGGQQVGFSLGHGASDRPHALLWRSSAAVVVDLHPRGFA
jgi:hypothetical protein